MKITSNTLLSSIIYLLIWVSFWGFIECLVNKFSRGDLNVQIVIYFSMLLLSYYFYVSILENKVDIKRYKGKEYEKNEEIISPVFF